MSKEIDERIVQMHFNNEQFEKGVKTTIESLSNLKKSLKLENVTSGFDSISNAARNVSLLAIEEGIDAVNNRFSALQVMARTALEDITHKAVNAGQQMVKSLTIDQVTTGFQKYEEKTASVQTLMNATGKSVDEVNEYLNDLMWFSDETSYSFTEMTAALAQMTSSGGDIDKLMPMITGIANATAFAGKGSREFQSTIRNLAQSYQAGHLQLLDMKSLDTMGTSSAQLKEAFIAAGEEMGKIEKGAVTIANFNETLQKKWADTEVMEAALGVFSEFSDAVREAVNNGEYETAAEAIEGMADQFDWVGVAAFKAGQTAKSFTEAVDATKDAVSTGWMETFEMIFGNYDEATELWTDLTNTMLEVFAASAESRNNLLGWWKQMGGRDSLIVSCKNAFAALMSVIQPVKEAFRDVFPSMMASQLYRLTEQLRRFTLSLILSEEAQSNLKSTFRGLFALLDIGIQIVGALVKPFLTLLGIPVKMAGSFTGGVLSITGGIGDMIYAFDRFIKRSGTLKRISDTISRAISSMAKSVSKGFKKAVAAFESFTGIDLRLPTFEDFANVLSVIGGALYAFGQICATAFEAVKGAFLGFEGTPTELAKSLQQATGVSSGFATTLVSIFTSIGRGLRSASDYILPVITELKDKIVEFVKTKIEMTGWESFGDFVDFLKDRVEALGNVLGTAYDQFKNFASVGNPFSGIASWFKGRGSALFGNFSAMGDGFSDMGGGIFSAFGKIKEVVGNVDFSNFESFSNSLKNAAGNVKDFFSSLTAEDLKKGAAIGAFATYLFELFKVLGGISKMETSVRGFIDSLSALNKAIANGKAWNPIKTAISAWGDAQVAIEKARVAAESFGTTFLKCAAGVLLLAGALFVLSYANPEGLASAMVALSIAMFELVAAVVIIEKVSEGGEGLEGVASLFSSLAVMILALAAAVAIFVYCSDGLNDALVNLSMAVTVLVYMIKSLVAAVTVAEATLPQLIGLAVVIAVFASAVMKLAIAIGVLSFIPWEKLVFGMLAVFGIMALFSLFAHVAGKATASLLKAAVAMNIFAVAVITLCVAVAALAAVGAMGGEIIRASVALFIVILAISAFTSVAGTVADGLLKFGAAVAIASLAFVALAGAMWIMAQIPADQIANNAIVLAVGIAALAICLFGLKAVAKDMLMAGAALGAFAIGILALAAAMWVIQGVNILAMAGQLIVLGVAMFGFSVILAAATKAIGNVGAIMAAASLAILAAAILVFAAAIKLVSKIPLGVFIAEIFAFIAALAVMAVTATAIAAATAPMAAVATVLLVMGVACIAVASSVLVLALGFQVLAAAAAALVPVILALSAVPVDKLNAGFDVIIVMLNRMAEIMVKTIGIVGVMALDLIMLGIGATVCGVGLLALGIGGTVAAIGIGLLVAAVVLLVLGLYTLENTYGVNNLLETMKTICYALCDAFAELATGVLMVAVACIILGVGLLATAVGIAAVALAATFGFEGMILFGVGLALVAASLLIIGAIVITVFGVLTGTLGDIAGSIGGFAESITSLGDSLTGFFGGIINSIKGLFSKSSGKELGKDYASGVSEGLEEGSGEVSEAVKAMTDKAAENFSTEEMETKASEGAKNTANAIKNETPAAEEASKNLSTSISKGFGDLDLSSVAGVDLDKMKGMLGGEGVNMEAITSMLGESGTSGFADKLDLSGVAGMDMDELKGMLGEDVDISALTSALGQDGSSGFAENLDLSGVADHEVADMLSQMTGAKEDATSAGSGLASSAIEGMLSGSEDPTSGNTAADTYIEGIGERSEDSTKAGESLAKYATKGADGVIGRFKTKGSQSGNNYAVGISSQTDNASKAGAAVASAAVGAMGAQDKLDLAKAAGSNLVGQMAQGASENTALTDAIQGIVSNALQAAQQSAPKSPSGPTKSGKDFADNTIGALLGALDGAGDTAVERINDTMDDLADAIQDGFDTVMDDQDLVIRPVMDLTDIETKAALLDALLSGKSLSVTATNASLIANGDIIVQDSWTKADIAEIRQVTRAIMEQVSTPRSINIDGATTIGWINRQLGALV